jgi:YebC/PmpR family DNA-binding regulatory protein
MGRAFEYRKAAKEKRWGTMSRVFPRLSKAITVAAKDGVPDPEMNAKLRAAIQNAKAQNMPKDNIEAAIKRAIGKDAADIKEITYEGKGPHGVLIMVETATDNNTRTVANIRNYFNKNGGQPLDNGALEFMFTRKAVFEFTLPEGMDVEELELNLIDAGLEELDIEGDSVIAYGDFTAFGELGKALEEEGIEVTKSSLKRIANSSITLTEEQMQEVDNLIDKIEEDEDVLAVYTNIE